MPPTPGPVSPLRSAVSQFAPEDLPRGGLRDCLYPLQQAQLLLRGDLLRDVAEQLKVTRFQYESNARRVTILGDAGLTLQDFDFYPGNMVPAMTPGEAVHAGASYLVVGRPITGAADPRLAARMIGEDATSSTI